MGREERLVCGAGRVQRWRHLRCYPPITINAGDHLWPNLRVLVGFGRRAPMQSPSRCLINSGGTVEKLLSSAGVPCKARGDARFDQIPSPQEVRHARHASADQSGSGGIRTGFKQKRLFPTNFKLVPSALLIAGFWAIPNAPYARVHESMPTHVFVFPKRLVDGAISSGAACLAARLRQRVTF